MSGRTLLLIAFLLAAPLAQGAALPKFTQPNAIWNQDVSSAPTRLNSAQMMTHLETVAASHGGVGKWGGDSPNSNVQFQIGFDFYVMHGTNATPTRPIVAFPDAGSYYTTDCEDPGFLFPLPAVGGIEGTVPPGYVCDTNNNDCHLLVNNDSTNILYESYFVDHADATGVHAICGLKWDLKKVYPRYGRGEHCTSADGAGFPMAPLLLNADEVWAASQSNGDIGHAIRFILGNTRMMFHAYVHPSSHGTLSTSDPDPNAVPYGSHLRLKSTFNVNGFSANPAVRAMLRSLQKYGMFLSDGGTIPLSAEADDFTQHKWADVDMNVDSHSLWGVNPTDFDVIESGDPMTVTYNCVRTPDDFIFIDGYDY